MNKIQPILFGILVISTVPVAVGSSSQQISDPGVDSVSIQQDTKIIERTVQSRGTNYTITVNLSNQTVRVDARHFANNQTLAGYKVTLNDRQIINKEWSPSQGETSQTQTDLLRKYYAGYTSRNLTLFVPGATINISYNYTVPRKHEGDYLRPTITEIEFKQVNQTYGRLTVTIRSDSKWTYPVSYQIWASGVEAEYLEVGAVIDENVSTTSIILPVDKGDPVKGEIRAHSGLLNQTGPLETQVEFYGGPGNVSFQRVPYEPLELNRVTEHTYVNESRDAGSGFRVSDGGYRRVLGGVGVVLLLVVVLGVLWGRRQRRV